LHRNELRDSRLSFSDNGTPNVSLRAVPKTWETQTSLGRPGRAGPGPGHRGTGTGGRRDWPAAGDGTAGTDWNTVTDSVGWPGRARTGRRVRWPSTATRPRPARPLVTGPTVPGRRHRRRPGSGRACPGPADGSGPGVRRTVPVPLQRHNLNQTRGLNQTPASIRVTVGRRPPGPAGAALSCTGPHSGTCVPAHWHGSESGGDPDWEFWPPALAASARPGYRSGPCLVFRRITEGSAAGRMVDSRSNAAGRLTSSLAVV
jgi:hypothetical protein